MASTTGGIRYTAAPHVSRVPEGTVAADQMAALDSVGAFLAQYDAVSNAFFATMKMMLRNTFMAEV